MSKLDRILRDVLPSLFYLSQSAKYEGFENRVEIFLDAERSMTNRDEFDCMDPLQDMVLNIYIEMIDRVNLGVGPDKYVFHKINEPDFGGWEFSMRDGRNNAFVGAEPEASREEYERMSIRMYGKIIRTD